jgi:hypothetical protein
MAADRRWVPTWAQAPQVDLLLGILLIFGFAVAVINGMLYKIVPFLAWFHLQAQLFQRAKDAQHEAIVAGRLRSAARVGLSGGAVAAGRRCSISAMFTYPAALALGVTGAWLGVNLAGVGQNLSPLVAIVACRSKIGLSRCSFSLPCVQTRPVIRPKPINSIIPATTRCTVRSVIFFSRRVPIITPANAHSVPTATGKTSSCDRLK